MREISSNNQCGVIISYVTGTDRTIVNHKISATVSPDHIFYKNTRHATECIINIDSSANSNKERQVQSKQSRP